MPTTTLRKPVLYLDLDGTVRHGLDELGHFVNGLDDVVIFPEALEKMRIYKAAGYAIAAISNQGGIATGNVTLDAVTQAITQTHRLCEGMFDAICICRHHPAADDPEIARCLCRKPRIGMIVQAQQMIERRYGCVCPTHLALFVGDREEDQLCAAAAGIDFMWAKEWRESWVVIPENKNPYERYDSE